jgi:hypothetical protein
MKLSTPLKAQLLEILLELSPQERQPLIEEMKEVILTISLEEKVSVFGPPMIQLPQSVPPPGRLSTN